MAIEKNIRAAYDRGRVVNPGGYAGEKDYDWSSKDDPELHQKMNDAVDKAVNEYLQKVKSGEISFPDNLQLEIDKVGNQTRHDMLQSQSDQPEIFSESLQEGLDKSNIQQKQKRSREQELLDEMNQTRLSNEDWLKEADARQLTAESPLSMTDFSYDVTAPPTTRGPMGDEMWATPNEGLSSVRSPQGWDYGNQWQTAKENEDDTQSWWKNLLKQGAASQIGKKLGWVGGLPGIMASGLTGGMGNFANTMRGGLTQRGYEQARQQRRDKRSVATLLARKEAADAGTGAFSHHAQKKLNELTMGSRPGHYDPPGGNGGVQGTDTPASGAGGWGPGAR